MSDAKRANRPSLGHVLLLVSCCAIYFALARRLWVSGSLPAPLLPELFALSLLSIVTGICWSGTIIVAYRKLRSSRVTTEPGDWLLFCIGLVEAAEMLSQLLPDTFVIRKSALPLAARCVVFVLPTLSRRLPPIWKVFFAILVLASAIPLSTALLMAFETLPASLPLSQISQAIRPYLVVTATAVAVYVDRRTGEQRGWSHWLGIACLLIWTFL